ncbi:MAG: LacI family DNA-binding transcriptional regulator [Clostridiales bacterium]|nr:LacI family DNA-binding transcriptional regulator [Clostridia bacterium]MCR4882052.1 LacI family DNA-binding transcriptional regulator [Clostridiales bacterium]
MKDVAREAGVALGTVSNVFNGAPVGSEYRRRVEEAALRLGYSVNSYARGLRADRTNTIAVILPTLQNSFFASLANAICLELTRNGLRMLLSTTEYDLEAESACIQMLRQNRVDGIIGLTYSETKVDMAGMPYVSIDRVISPSIPCVTSDNYGGGALAARKLLELGCRKLLYLRTGSTVIGETNKRGGGFAAECSMQDVDFTLKSFNDEYGMEPIVQYLDSHLHDGRLDFDGIFCSTDMLLDQVARFLRQRSVRIPDDVQMIGFDGIRRFFKGDYICSTIVQPVELMAETCVDLVSNWNQSRLSALISLPVTYAPGGTTREQVLPDGQ